MQIKQCINRDSHWRAIANGVGICLLGIGLSACGSSGGGSDDESNNPNQGTGGFLDPYVTTLYLRGSMNEWGAEQAMSFELSGDNEYTAVVALTADAHQFKVADADWSDGTDFGVEVEGTEIILNQPLELMNQGTNIGITVDQTRGYEFVLDASNSLAPSLTVSLQDIAPSDPETADLYLRGEMNDWAAQPAYRFTRDSETALHLTVPIDKGGYQFKIADSGWSPATNFGGDGGTTLVGESTQLTVGETSTNLLLVLDADGDVGFDLDLTNPSAPVLNVSGSLSDAARKPPSDQEAFNELRIYQIMVEAFQDGDPTANYDAAWGNSQHKGDLKGITQALPYIKSLGMNAIWLTPIFDSESLKDGTFTHRLDATGYFTRNYFAIDPNFGTMDDAREMVETAHSLGIYVFLDGVFGHHKGNPTPSPSGLLPEGPSNPVDYPESLAFYQEVATYWIKELGIDGWRLDQADQVPIEMWEQIRLAVEETAAERKAAGEEWGTLGYMVAERFSGNPSEIQRQIYGDETLRGLRSAFDFPMRFTMVDVFAGNAPASSLNNAYLGHLNYPEDVAPNLFMTNHDVPRFGDLLQRTGISGKDDPEYWARHRLALSFLASYTGPITLYYGDEIGDEVVDFVFVPDNCGQEGKYCEDHVSRSDGQISGFDTNQTQLKDFWTELMQLRAANDPIWNGSSVNLIADPTRYVDLKQHDGDRIIYAVNLGEEATQIELEQAVVSGSKLIPLLDGAEVVESGGAYNINMPALSVQFYSVE